MRRQCACWAGCGNRVGSHHLCPSHGPEHSPGYVGAISVLSGVPHCHSRIKNRLYRSGEQTRLLFRRHPAGHKSQSLCGEYGPLFRLCHPAGCVIDGDCDQVLHPQRDLDPHSSAVVGRRHLCRTDGPRATHPVPRQSTDGLLVNDCCHLGHIFALLTAIPHFSGRQTECWEEIFTRTLIYSLNR